MPTQAHASSRQPSKAAIKAAHLLARYPAISDRELTRLVRSYAFLPMPEVRLMMGDDEFMLKTAAFERDHARKLRALFAALLAGLLLVALVAIVLAWSIWTGAGASSFPSDMSWPGAPDK